VLLLDEQGDVLWGPEAKADLVLSVMLAARAATRSSAASALGARLATSLSHQDLGGGKGTLSVFSCATEQGLIIVGIERAAALCESAARELAAALEATVDRQT
jgi:cation transporter-like permease